MARVLIDAQGAVIGVGDVAFAPARDQAVQDTPLTLEDFAAADAAGQASGQPYDVILAGGKFAHRTRKATAAEQERDAQKALVAQLRDSLAKWDTMTQAQKNAATKALIQAALGLLQGR